MRYLPVVAKMALRNVGAYRRRSLETFIVVFVGALAVATVDAFMNGFFERIVSGFAVAGGHARAAAPGYEARRAICPLDRLVPDPEGLAAAAGEAAEAARGAGKAAAYESIVALPSLRSACSLQRGDRGVNLYATGADAWLPSGGLAPPFAAELEAGAYPRRGEAGIVLSSTEAARLGARVGDLLIILAGDAFGSFSMAELPLLGVARGDPGPEPCLVDLASMRSLLGVETGASEVALYLVDARGAPIDPRRGAAGVAALEAAVLASGLEATRWDAPGGFAAATMDFFDSFLYAMYAIFVVVAAAGIANSVLLSVQDRIRDFGTLRAVAFPARWVKAIVALETLMVGAAASLAAILVAAAAVAGIGPEGLRLPQSVRGIVDWMPLTVPARMDPAALALIFVGGSLAPLVAAAYPLRVLGKMKIREALGYV